MHTKESLLQQYKAAMYGREMLQNLHGDAESGREALEKINKKLRELEALSIIMEVKLPSPKS